MRLGSSFNHVTRQSLKTCVTTLLIDCCSNISKATKQSYSEGGGGWWRGINGILRMTVVDLVFTDSIQNGLFKQDILDIMEVYGLTSKFSSSSSKDYQVVEYFVPAQLRYKSPISWSVQDKWSVSTIYPFPWCICSTWALFINGARLVNGMRCAFQLSLIWRKRFIKVVLKMVESEMLFRDWVLIDSCLDENGQ